MEGEEEGEEGSCKQQRKLKKRHIQGYDSAYEEAEVEPLRIQVEAGCLAIFKTGIKHGSAFLNGSGRGRIIAPCDRDPKGGNPTGVPRAWGPGVP